MINAWSFSAGKALGANPSPGMSMTGNAMRLMQRSSAERYTTTCRRAARMREGGRRGGCRLPGARHPRRARPDGAGEGGAAAARQRCAITAW